MEAGITTEQREKVVLFQSVCGNQYPENQVIQLLKNCGWDVNSAVTTALAAGPSLSSRSPAPGAAGGGLQPPGAPPSTVGPGRPLIRPLPHPAPPRQDVPCGGIFAAPPLSWLCTGLQTLFGLLSNFLPDVLVRYLRWTFARCLATRRISMDGEFRKMDRGGGLQLPEFQDMTFQEACRMAQTNKRMLFVYLHSSTHDATPAFVRNVLCNTAVAQYLNNNFVCYAGDLRSTDALAANRALRGSSYPFVAVAACGRRGNQITIRCLYHSQARAPGADALLAQLANCSQHFQQHREQRRARRQATVQSRSIRATQDDEYNRIIEEARQQQEHQEREQQEADRQLAELERSNSEELARQSAAQRALDEEQTRREEQRGIAMSLVPDEPAAGPGAVNVRVRLPNGQALQRRFAHANTIQDLSNFIKCNDLKNGDGERITNFKIIQSYPRKEFQNLAATFAESGLTHSANLFVQEVT